MLVAQLQHQARAVQRRHAKERAMFGLPCPTMSGPTLVDYREVNTSQIRPWKKVADYKTISASNPYRIKTLRRKRRRINMLSTAPKSDHHLTARNSNCAK